MATAGTLPALMSPPGRANVSLPAVQAHSPSTHFSGSPPDEGGGPQFPGISPAGKTPGTSPAPPPPPAPVAPSVDGDVAPPPPSEMQLPLSPNAPSTSSNAGLPPPPPLAPFMEDPASMPGGFDTPRADDAAKSPASMAFPSAPPAPPMAGPRVDDNAYQLAQLANAMAYAAVVSYWITALILTAV